jgi:hypothetical protein
LHGGDVLARLSDDMVRAKKQFFGKGPERAKSYMLDDMLFVVMRGGLTTAEQTMLREAVAKIAADYGHDYFAAKARAGEKTTELWQAVGQAGFVGVNLPEEYGGGGMGISELAIVTEELAAQGCPLLLLMVSPAICGTLLARFGTPEQRERWLPAIASGERKMVFAITEPDAGSNSHRLDTAATRDGGGWRPRPCGGSAHSRGPRAHRSLLGGRSSLGESTCGNDCAGDRQLAPARRG